MGTRINEYGEIVRDDLPKLSVSAKVLNFDSSGGTRTVYITISQGDWNVKVERGFWIDVDKTSYGISIRMPHNATDSTRYGSILIYSSDGKAHRRIEIVQEGGYEAPPYTPPPPRTSYTPPSANNDGCWSEIWPYIVGLGLAFLYKWLSS